VVREFLGRELETAMRRSRRTVVLEAVGMSRVSLTLAGRRVRHSLHMKCRMTLLRFGATNTGIEGPEEILTAPGRGRRLKVVGGSDARRLGVPVDRGARTELASVGLRP
jgi:hypothetical protein